MQKASSQRRFCFGGTQKALSPARTGGEEKRGAPEAINIHGHICAGAWQLPSLQVTTSAECQLHTSILPPHAAASFQPEPEEVLHHLQAQLLSVRRKNELTAESRARMGTSGMLFPGGLLTPEAQLDTSILPTHTAETFQLQNGLTDPSLRMSQVCPEIFWTAFGEGRSSRGVTGSQHQLLLECEWAGCIHPPVPRWPTSPCST